MRSRVTLSAVVAIFLLAFLSSGRATAQDLPPREWGSAEIISGFAVVDRTAVSPGERFRLVIDLEIEATWHIYGNPLGPGIGEPTVARVKPPEGVQFGPPLYSKPFKLDQTELGPEEWVWAYEGHARIFLSGSVMPGTRPGMVEIPLVIECQACSSGKCVSETLEISAGLNIVPPGAESRPAYTDLFKDFEGAKPAGGAGAPPRTAPSKETLDPSTMEAINGYTPRTSGEEASGTVQSEKESLWVILLLGFLAGMILNIMPCVLPVVSIKIMSLVQQAGEDRGRILLHGISFSGGILVIFLVLAGAAAFAGQSWGTHFQNVEFQVAMIALIFLFSLGLFDIYNIGVPGFVSRRGGEIKEGLAGSFSKGMLATLLATPCSGPFLGAVLAFALDEKPVIVFLVFTSIGLGMALPYLVLTVHPAFLRFVPKSGPWMVRFKEFMGFLLLGTVVYLLTIVADDLKVWVVALCLILGLAAWIFGRVTGPARSLSHRLFWRVSAVVVAVGLGYFSHGILVDRAVHDEFDFARLQALGRQGRTVVVDWTADWCPNCKLVEKVVLQSDEVQKAMEARNVVFMVADITREKPVAEALMHRLGSRSIPFLGVFPGNDPGKPFVLRDIYSRADLLEVLDRCP